ncbi:MAG: histidine kinase [Bacteroidales bacterium]|nr:histidine kinase [Bacteroidales bacterium]HOI31836.1 histidine kinase [Bacteroidales bacterium]
MEQTPASSRITSLARKSDDELWIGTADGGLDAMNIETFEFKHFTPTTNPGILSVHVRTLKNHPDGSLYIGFWEGKGFGRMAKGSNVFEHFSYDPTSFKKDWYNDFEFTQQGDVYLGFWGGPGLTLFRHKSGVFGTELAGQMPDPYYDRLINALAKSNDGKVWIATTQSGVVCYNEMNKQSTTYFEEKRNGGGIDEKQIYDVALDFQGNIWACGSQLYLYDSHKDCFVKQSLGLNLKFMEIFRIHPVRNGNLWLLTLKGLMRFDPERNWLTDFSSHVRLSFKFNQAAALQWDEDVMILGGSNGFAMIENDKLGFLHAFPKVFLTHLDVFNETFIPLLAKLEEVNLAHNQNFFAIHFGTDRWEKDQPYTYFTKLEGFDNDWRMIMPQQKSMYFTNVPAGTYIFKMRTGDAYGNKSDQEARLVIHIKAAWWKQWWFFTAAAMLIVGFFGFLWYLRIRDEKMKWQNTDLNQQLLRLQMNPHFIFNSLTSIQNYIYSNQTHLAGQYLSDFARLIRLILENSRHESISLDKEIETIKLYMNLQQLRFTGKIDFSIKVDPDIDTEVTYVPPMMAQPFLENAIEHGIKNNNKDGVIEVCYQLIGSRIRFEVRDNGIGIVASKKFVQDSQSIKKESLSIKICRERLQLLERKTKRKIPFLLDEIIEDGQVKGTRVAFEVPLKGSFLSKKLKT